MLPLPSCASPGMLGPESRHSGSSAGIRDSKTLAWVKDQTGGLSTLCPGCPSLAPAWPRPPGPSAAPSSDTGQTHAGRARPGRGRAQCGRTHTDENTRVHAQAHHLPFSLEAAQATQEPRSFIRASIIAKRQQRRGGEALDPRRRLCCRTARASALAVLPPPRPENHRNPQKLRPRTRAAPAAPLRHRGAGAGSLRGSFPALTLCQEGASQKHV